MKCIYEVGIDDHDEDNYVDEDDEDDYVDEDDDDLFSMCVVCQYMTLGRVAAHTLAPVAPTMLS